MRVMDFVSVVPVPILYGIALFTWGLIELDAALKRRRGINVEDSLSIATNLDTIITRRWLLVILVTNTGVALFSFLMVECMLDIRIGPGCFGTSVEAMIYNTIWPSLGVMALAGLLIRRLPDLRGTKDWSATVSIGFLSTTNSLLLIGALLGEQSRHDTYFVLIPFIFSITGVVFSFRVMTAVNNERVTMMRGKVGPEETKTSDKVRIEKSEDDYSKKDLDVNEATMVAIIMAIPWVVVVTVLGFFDIIPWEWTIIGGGVGFLTILLFGVAKPEAMVKIGRPLYRYNYDNIVAGERHVPNIVNDDGDVPGGWTKEQWEKYGDSSKKH
ncbi:MAG: hypothetical protein QF707_02195 [Candidatus Poseidoniaceae archaeon]|nr:hypothetical protein [Candidatus Poseidoniaceae archaeon]